MKLGGLSAAGRVLEAPAMEHSATYLPPREVDTGNVIERNVVDSNVVFGLGLSPRSTTLLPTPKWSFVGFSFDVRFWESR